MEFSGVVMWWAEVDFDGGAAVILHDAGCCGRDLVVEGEGEMR